MANLKESWHFVPAQRIPRIEGSTPFRKVYTQLYGGGCGGFLLTEEGRVTGYVKGYELAQDAITSARGDADRLREITGMPIRRAVIELNQAKSLIPVPTVTIDWTSEEGQLRGQPETVFNVTAANDTIGWYLNHETVRETATKKTIFLCTRGHKNTDPDHGTCSYCPALLDQTTEEYDQQ